MQIELLTLPGCPNAAPARELIADCLGSLGLDLEIVERVGSYPSPTILIDGVDVMGHRSDALSGDACRLDLPTRDRLLALLDPRGDAAQFVTVASSVRQLPAAVREIHRGVLRTFLTRGCCHRDDLRAVAADLPIDLGDALGILGDVDLVHLSADGEVDVAYPFSGRSTAHTVRIEGRPVLTAMCALDAIGIPLMAGKDGTVESVDPAGGPITVRRQGDAWIWQPRSAVIVIGRSQTCGTLADTACQTMTFHADAVAAQAHLDSHPLLHGTILDQAAAVDLAAKEFGWLLDP